MFSNALLLLEYRRRSSVREDAIDSVSADQILHPLHTKINTIRSIIHTFVRLFGSTFVPPSISRFVRSLVHAFIRSFNW